MTRPAAVLVMAAGEGTRMKSATPKVLHRIAGRTLLGHTLKASAAVDPERLVVIVGAGRDQVVQHLSEVAPDAQPVAQEPRNGTGHAVRIGMEALDRLNGAPVCGTVVVTSGDSPLLRGETLVELVRAQQESGAAAALLTAVVDDPTGYGRVLRDASGSICGMVEQKDATEEQREIREINTGFYAFDAAPLRAALGELTTDNAQGEEYLVDVVGIFYREGAALTSVLVEDLGETAGVNNRAQLAEAGAVLRDRINQQWMSDGVTIVDPASTWIDATVTLEPDAMILPNTLLEGATTVASCAVVGPGSRLRDTSVGEGATVEQTTALEAEIGPEATVGPYTYLRPGTRLGRKSKAGAYVEIKAATIGEGSKVPHLSYVGDAEIGQGSNIGAATVFVNYDGVNKHRTVIGNAVRIGSDTMLVAPLTIGDGAYTGAGAVITADVPPGALAIKEGRQRNVEGWVEQKRPGTAAAEAARQAREAAASDATPGGC